MTFTSKLTIRELLEAIQRITYRDSSGVYRTGYYEIKNLNEVLGPKVVAALETLREAQ